MEELGNFDQKNNSDSDISYSGHSYFEGDEDDNSLTLQDTTKGELNVMF